MHSIDTSILCSDKGILILITRDGREYKYNLPTMDSAQAFLGKTPMECPIVRDMIEAGLEQDEAEHFVVDLFCKLSEAIEVASLKFIISGILPSGTVEPQRETFNNSPRMKYRAGQNPSQN